jgi:hypothetical protein
MKTVEEYRREKLELAVMLAGGTLEALAEMAGLSSAYLSQVRNALGNSKSGTPRSLGKTAARKIEGALRKPKGWMDHGEDDRPIAAQDDVEHRHNASIRLVSDLDAVSEAELVNAIEVLQKLLRAKRGHSISGTSPGDEADIVRLSAGEPTAKRQTKKHA